MPDHKIIDILTEELEIEFSNTSISEEELLEAIGMRVGTLMDTDSGLLFSYLYRLDVTEASLNQVLNSPSKQPLSIRIAELILKRQKARIITKRSVDSGEVPDGWEW